MSMVAHMWRRRTGIFRTVRRGEAKTFASVSAVQTEASRVGGAVVAGQMAEGEGGSGITAGDDEDEGRVAIGHRAPPHATLLGRRPHFWLEVRW